MSCLNRGQTGCQTLTLACLSFLCQSTMAADPGSLYCTRVKQDVSQSKTEFVFYQGTFHLVYIG